MVAKTTARCNCGGPCQACLRRCNCNQHWHHPNQAQALEEERQARTGTGRLAANRKAHG